jgi:uroporphyrinogen III methyltransferase/synthase
MIPAIKIEPIWEVAGLEGALNDVERYSWIVFTSVNGVDTIKNRLAQMGGSFDLLAACRVAAIGPATADALKASGIHAEFVPEEYVGEELGDGIDVKPGDRVLLPRAKGSRPALPNLLAQRGARVDEFSVYKAVAAKWDPGVVGELEIGVDALTFTSPSTVRNFIQGGRDQGLEPLRLPGKPAVACIGPITAAAATEAGYQVTVEAEEYTIPGLVGALCRHFQRKNN